MKLKQMKKVDIKILRLWQAISLALLILAVCLLISTLKQNNATQAHMERLEYDNHLLEQQLDFSHWKLDNQPTKEVEEIKLKVVAIIGDMVYIDVNGETLELESPRTINTNEYKNMAMLVNAEATSRGLDAKRNVAITILNRVDSNEFPNTINEVIFQRNQFQPTFDGRMESEPMQDNSYQAVKEAVLEEDRHDALFFYVRKYSSENGKNFFDTLEYLFNDGTHEFFK